MRAAQWKQLYDPVLPTIFLAWAKRTEIDVPTALVDEVAKRDRIADWKSLYDELKAVHQEKETAWRATDEAKDRRAASLQDHICKLEARIPPMAAQQQSKPTEKPLGTRERDTLLKIIIGMALAGYKYDPALSRSPIPQEIADDLAQQGVAVDVDTVRK